MHALMSLFIAALFVALTPGIFVRIPMGSSKLVVAVTHGLIFAVVYHLTHKMAWNALYPDGFSPMMAPMMG